MTISTIGFIGLGVMGEAMCRNLARKGSWKVIAFDQKVEPLERLRADGVGVATSLRGLVQASDVILMCLPGGREVEIVTQGASTDIRLRWPACMSAIALASGISVNASASTAIWRRAQALT